MRPNYSSSYLASFLMTALAMFSSALFSQECDWAQQESETLAAEGDSTFSFSHSIGVDGAQMLIGDPALNGHVYAYQRIGGSWVFQNEIPSRSQEFGSSITMHGDTAFIGGSISDNDGQVTYIQHVFHRVSNSWLFEQTLPGGSDQTNQNDVSLTTDFALVGDKMYHYDGKSWSLQSVLDSDSCTGCNSTKSSAVSGTLALVGHPFQTINGAASTGAVHMYRLIDSQWVPSGVLNGQPGAGGEFGFSVSIADSSVLIGARFESNGGSNGVVHVYEDDGTNLIHTQQFSPSDNIFSGEFGSRIRTDGDIAVVNARFSSGPVSNGTAYVFKFDGTNWIEELKLSGSDTSSADRFAQDAIEVAGSEAFVGAAGGQGKLYVYNIACLSDSCPADLTGDGELNFFDVAEFLEAYLGQDPIADFNADGEFNFFDVGDFLDAFHQGCP